MLLDPKDAQVDGVNQLDLLLKVFIRQIVSGIIDLTICWSINWQNGVDRANKADIKCISHHVASQ